MGLSTQAGDVLNQHLLTFLVCEAVRPWLATAEAWLRRGDLPASAADFCIDRTAADARCGPGPAVGDLLLPTLALTWTISWG